MSELMPLPCPFCGNAGYSQEEIVDRKIWYYFQCGTCASSTGRYGGYQSAKDRWNRRAQPYNGKVRPIDANTLRDEIARLQIFLAGESFFTPAIKETVLRTIDEQATIATIQPDNAPLTLEELRGMDGDRVWLDDTRNPVNSGWHLVNTEKGFLIDMCGWKIPLPCLGNERIAYRRKPEPEGGEG